MAERMTFTVNGKERTVDYEPEMMLIDVLREVLNLTGTKHGCDNSTCGTCTVVMDGKAIKSCNTPAAKAAGTSVVTVEGLAKDGALHPVQKAISESGAVQCGFCTPGIVMELYGLLEANPDANETEMTNALNKHLCRCTGYEPIRDGALIAQKMIKETRK